MPTAISCGKDGRDFGEEWKENLWIRCRLAGMGPGGRNLRRGGVSHDPPVYRLQCKGSCLARQDLGYPGQGGRRGQVHRPRGDVCGRLGLV